MKRGKQEDNRYDQLVDALAALVRSGGLTVSQRWVRAKVPVAGTGAGR